MSSGLHAARELAASAVEALAFVIEMVAAAIILGAAALALVRAARTFTHGTGDPLTARRGFVHGLIFALDLFIAADVIKTVVAPTMDTLLVLGGTIAIRTVLTLVLEFEMRSEERREEEEA